MAVGDRVKSTDYTSLMRRINALENTFGYTSSGSLNGSAISGFSSWYGGDLFAAKLATQFGGTPVQRPAIYSVDDTTGSLTTIVSNGDAEGQVNNDQRPTGTPVQQIDVDASAGGYVFATDTADESGTKYYRVQRWSSSGTHQWTHKISDGASWTSSLYPRYIEVVGMTDGSCYVREREDATTYNVSYIGSNGSGKTKLFTYTSNSTTNGDTTEAFPTMEFTENKCAVYRNLYNGYTKVEIYSGTSVDETYTISTYDTSPQRADCFTVPRTQLLTGEYASRQLRAYTNTQPDATDGLYRGINFADNGGTNGDAPTRVSGLAFEIDCADDSGNVYDGFTKYTKDAETQTTFYKYLRRGFTAQKTSLGTPDLGVSIPALNALEGELIHSQMIVDMRNTLSSIAGDFINPATGSAYTTSVGTNNIFRVAIDSGQDDWTTGVDPTTDDRVRSDHLTDMQAVILQLETSARV